MLGKPEIYNGREPLRHALGDDCTLEFREGANNTEVLIAAARAHHLLAPDSPPSLPVAKAQYGDDQRVCVEGALHEDPTVPFSLVEIAFSIDPFTMTATDPANKQSWIKTWESLGNPCDTDASCMAGNLGHLFDGEATWTYAACRLCIAAATNDRGETRVLATDALIQAIEAGLVCPLVLGKALGDTIQWVKLNRVCLVLQDSAVGSPFNQWTICNAVDTAIQCIEKLPKDGHRLLSLLNELATSLGISASKRTREKLATIKGASKAAKIAKQILVLQDRPHSLLEVHCAILATTVERGERWGSILSSNDAS